MKQLSRSDNLEKAHYREFPSFTPSANICCSMPDVVPGTGSPGGNRADAALDRTGEQSPLTAQINLKYKRGRCHQGELQGLEKLIETSHQGDHGRLPRGGDARTKTRTNSAIRIIQLCLLHLKIKGDNKLYSSSLWPTRACRVQNSAIQQKYNMSHIWHFKFSLER